MQLDIEAVRKAKAGDKESFTYLYGEVYHDMYKFALYTLGNAHDAEDVVSEAFIEAYGGISGLRDEMAFKAWIMRILSTRCKRKIREYVKGKTIYNIDDFLNLERDDENLEQQSSDRLSVLQAMMDLTESERQILVLAAVQGYTTKEVAKILSLPHGTVSSKLHRTLTKLRTRLEDGTVAACVT